MTRLDEIRRRVERDTSCLCGLPHCQRCIDANELDKHSKQDITYLLSLVQKYEGALKRIASQHTGAGYTYAEDAREALRSDEPTTQQEGR